MRAFCFLLIDYFYSSIFLFISFVFLYVHLQFRVNSKSLIKECLFIRSFQSTLFHRLFFKLKTSLFDLKTINQLFFNHLNCYFTFFTLQCSSPSLLSISFLRELASSIVQSVERRTVNPYVTGSSPVGGAKFRKARTISVRAFCFSSFLLSLPFFFFYLIYFLDFRVDLNTLFLYFQYSAWKKHPIKKCLLSHN